MSTRLKLPFAFTILADFTSFYLNNQRSIYVELRIKKELIIQKQNLVLFWFGLIYLISEFQVILFVFVVFGWRTNTNCYKIVMQGVTIIYNFYLVAVKENTENWIVLCHKIQRKQVLYHIFCERHCLKYVFLSLLRRVFFSNTFVFQIS
jgi:hypothetical protein